MLSPAQRDFLISLFGSEEDGEGDFFTTMKDDTSCTLGTKLLYLDRAIKCNCADFLNFLDKLYEPNLSDSGKRKQNLGLVMAFKQINDHCFNNEIKNGDFGTKSALDYLATIGSSFDAEEAKTEIKSMIAEMITQLSSLVPSAQISAEQVARIEAETGISERAGWRGEHRCNLPTTQLHQEQVLHDSYDLAYFVLYDLAYFALFEEEQWGVINRLSHLSLDTRTHAIIGDIPGFFSECITLLQNETFSPILKEVIVAILGNLACNASNQEKMGARTDLFTTSIRLLETDTASSRLREQIAGTLRNLACNASNQEKMGARTDLFTISIRLLESDTASPRLKEEIAGTLGNLMLNNPKNKETFAFAKDKFTTLFFATTDTEQQRMLSWCLVPFLIDMTGTECKMLNDGGIVDYLSNPKGFNEEGATALRQGLTFFQNKLDPSYAAVSSRVGAKDATSEPDIDPTVGKKQLTK